MKMLINGWLYFTNENEVLQTEKVNEINFIRLTAAL